MTSDEVDLREVAEFALNVAERCQAAGRAALQTIPRDQIMHVDYDDLVADPVAMARSASTSASAIRTDPGLEARMADWLKAIRATSTASTAISSATSGLPQTTCTGGSRSEMLARAAQLSAQRALERRRRSAQPAARFGIDLGPDRLQDARVIGVEPGDLVRHPASP